MKFVHLCLGLSVIATLACGCSKSEKTIDEQSAVTPPVAPVNEQGASDMSDAVIVTVNDQTLTRGEADEMVRELAGRQGVPPQMLDAFLQQAGEQLHQQVISQFVDRVLLSAEVARRDIVISDADVSNVIVRISETLPEGMTLDQALSTRGMTMEKLQADIRDNEKTRKLFETETAGLEAVTDAQVSSFYTNNPQYFQQDASVQASHILIGCKEDADEAEHAKAAAEAEAVRKQLEEGADFAELAKEKSSCPSKDKGGDLGSFGKGQMVPAFEEAAFSQEVGAVGPVVKSPFGYHIIKVTKRTDATVQPIEEATDQIREHLGNQARQEKFEVFLKGLREGATISYAEGNQPAE